MAQIAQFMSWVQVKQLAEAALKAEIEKKYEKAFPLFQQTAKECLQFITHGAKTDADKDLARKLCQSMIGKANAARNVLSSGGKSALTEEKTASRKRKASDSDDETGLQVAEKRLTAAVLSRSIVIEKDHYVTFADVVGLEKAKKALKKSVVFPMKYPTMMEGMSPWQAILLFGPPGTGKTHVARAIANEYKSTLFVVSSATLASKYHGESELMLSLLFKQARKNKPSIIFMDEIDWLCSVTSGAHSEAISNMKSELLTQMDGANVNNKGVLVVAATNKPANLDQSFRRRFEARIYVPLPTLEDRVELFRKNLLKKGPNSIVTENELNDLAVETEGYSGADIALCVRDARMEAVDKVDVATYFKITDDGLYTPCTKDTADGIEMNSSAVSEDKLCAPPISYADVRISLKQVSSTVTPEMIAEYEEFDRTFGQKS